MLDAPDTIAAIQDAVLLREEHLQGAWHLAWLAEQQASVEQIEVWRRKHQATGSESTRAFLTELSEAVKRYMSVVLQPVIDALSDCERSLLSDSRNGPRRSAADYLDAFLDWQTEPGVVDRQDDFLSTALEQQAREHAERGEVSWHGMSGSVPVWYHIVTSPQERAAALAYSGAPAASVVKVKTGAAEPGDFFGLFANPRDETDEWYPEPGIEIRYADASAFDLCGLLAVSQLGHARLEFLTVRPDGGVQLLRSVRARVRDEDTVTWRRWALASLSTIAPEPDDLVDAIARQEHDADDADDRDEPDPRMRSHETPAPPSDSSASGPRSTGSGLPAALVGKVRALLRQAEDPAVGEKEARAFLEKATGLMAKYGIEQAMLDAVSEPAKPVDKVVELHPPYVKEMRRLLARIAYEMRCPSVYPGGKDNKHRVHLFGFDADLQAAEVLFASLRLQMLNGADRADRLYRSDDEDARAYKRSWMLGFIREVSERVGAAQQSASAAADAEQQAGPHGAASGGRSVALVLADRSVVVEAQRTARYPNLTKARPTKFKGTGYWQGVADGKRADIGGVR
ncbi:DUF2786 domain-containing protein [Streptomyces sp. NBC_00057]|uniref:DUF2786 domain-containing protein n=1 Tax=Streptomyces sp. NBC_00057 TaxID=2975634 RepID=UPI00324B7DF5